MFTVYQLGMSISLSVSAKLQYLAILLTLHPHSVFIISLLSPERYSWCLHVITGEIIYTALIVPSNIYSLGETGGWWEVCGCQLDKWPPRSEMNKLRHYNTCRQAVLLLKCPYLWECHCELFQGAWPAKTVIRFQISHLMLWYSAYH